jgi:hypothetical protein
MTTHEDLQSPAEQPGCAKISAVCLTSACRNRTRLLARGAERARLLRSPATPRDLDCAFVRSSTTVAANETRRSSATCSSTYANALNQTLPVERTQQSGTTRLPQPRKHAPARRLAGFGGDRTSCGRQTCSQASPSYRKWRRGHAGEITWDVDRGRTILAKQRKRHSGEPRVLYRELSLELANCRSPCGERAAQTPQCFHNPSSNGQDYPA